MSTRGLMLLLAVLAASAGLAVVVAERQRPGESPSRREAGELAPPDDRQLLERLLDRRARALERADAGALARTAIGDQRAVDRRHARRLRGLGVREVRLRLQDADVQNGRARLAASLTYAVRGIGGRFTSLRRLTAVRADSGWRIAASSGRRGRPPWEVADQRRLTSEHFVVWAPESVDPRTGGLVAALESGYGRMRDVLSGVRLRRRYLVVVAADAAQARALTASIRGVGGLAAITDTEVHQEGPAERVASVASQRLLVVWSGFLDAGPDARETVVTHELTHAAMAGATSGRTPAWLTEALALYVSGDQRVDQAARLLLAEADRRALSLTGLTEPDSIGDLTGPAQTSAYAYSSAAAFYIVERFGRSALLDLYDAFNDEDLVGEAGDPELTDAAVRRELRVSLARLQRELRRWILSRPVVAPLGG